MAIDASREAANRHCITAHVIRTKQQCGWCVRTSSERASMYADDRSFVYRLLCAGGVSKMSDPSTAHTARLLSHVYADVLTVRVVHIVVLIVYIFVYVPGVIYGVLQVCGLRARMHTPIECRWR
jgi:hypothetical protein